MYDIYIYMKYIGIYVYMISQWYIDLYVVQEVYIYMLYMTYVYMLYMINMISKWYA